MAILLKLLKFILWPTMWSVLVNVPCELEKNVYCTVVGLSELDPNG